MEVFFIIRNKKFSFTQITIMLLTYMIEVFQNLTNKKATYQEKRASYSKSDCLHSRLWKSPPKGLVK